MDKSEKRRCKQPAATSNSIIANYPRDNDDDHDDKNDQWRKYRQGRILPAYHDRSERRQSKSPIDTTMGYHYPPDISRLRNHHISSSSSSRAKYQIPSVPEEVYRAGSKNYGILKALRGYPNNFAVVRKPRYKDDEEDDSKYVEEDPVDNPEEETGEEIVDEEPEDVSEYSDKDYEEQEADDEVDEESDVLESQVERPKTQKKNRLELPTRSQKTSNNIKPSHFHYEQKIGIEKNSQRCCHVADERDNVDVPSEDDEEHRDLCKETTCPTKKTTRKYRGHQDKESRNIPMNVLEKYSNFNKMASGSVHQNRRPRTTRPEMESSMALGRVHHETIRNNTCSKCGVLTGQRPKTTSSKNANRRLQDTRYYTRIPIGDEVECFEDPEPTISYQPKARRSKESKSADYGLVEESKILDADFEAFYKSCRTKNPRDWSNDHNERTRHATRLINRHDPLPSSKNDNRYWK